MFKSTFGITRSFAIAAKSVTAAAITAMGLLIHPSSAYAHFGSEEHSFMHAVMPVGFVILMVAFLYIQINKLRN